MNTQIDIKKELSKPASLAYIGELLGGNKELNLSRVGTTVCDHFGFRDEMGRFRLRSCLRALRELEAEEHFRLPEVTKKAGSHAPRRLGEEVPLPQETPLEVSGFRSLRVLLVETPAQMLIWNELMSEHPLGCVPFVGRQLRYLISSEHGWLGGIGFAAGALQLSDRDQWIGWGAEERRKYLHYVVGMSRFLIRPSVRCRNLASKVLSMSMMVLGDDFASRYGYRPWLVETFVDSGYSGACYRAANWVNVGSTRGRGRHDRSKEYALSKKAIYVYVLDKDFRRRMGLSSEAGRGSLGVADGLEGEQWAKNEFGGASLGDVRLSRRLEEVARAQAQAPESAFSGVAKGDWPLVKAYYRMIDQPEESEVTMENILAPHRERTVRRMSGQRTVLCIQDGSDLDYTNLAQCEGLGEIGTNQTGAKSRGLHLHSTFAVAPNGLPLGVLRAQCIAPAGKSPEEERPVSAIPIEEKKTFVWLEHHRNLVELSAQMPQTRLVDICDREADFFEMFDEQRRHSGVALLVRARYNRNVNEEPFKLFAAAREGAVLSRVSVHIPRQSARPKRSKQKARPARPGRMAELVVRSAAVELCPARYHADKEPISLWVVHAIEENPPEGSKPIEWFLLTTIEIAAAEDAEQCLRWYCLRWRIEDWHRVLKSGCKIEDLGHESAQRLRRAIAIRLVIAWRIMLMTLLGREAPELPADVLFSDIELRTLKAYAKKKRLPPPVLLGDAVRLVAKLGGYLNRNNDPPPGHQVLWRGYFEFQFMCLGFALMEEQ